MVLLSRVGLIVLSLGLWFLTQRWISRRPLSFDQIGDRLHQLTQGANEYLNRNAGQANALLIFTSALIDGLGIYLIVSALLGPSLRPFIGLFLLFALRQLCQWAVALPGPQGMIWRHPGFPSLLVTYGTANDFFFSGHTAIAVYGAVELCRTGSLPIGALGVAIALLEVATVIVLRAHWTADVFAGTLAALGAAWAAPHIAPLVDTGIAALGLT
jgi:hypothetical protein